MTEHKRRRHENQRPPRFGKQEVQPWHDPLPGDDLARPLEPVDEDEDDRGYTVGFKRDGTPRPLDFEHYDRVDWSGYEEWGGDELRS